ncbi:MAG: antitoxin [Gammaproteobacteria bacterium]
MSRLDEEEKEILGAFERGELNSISDKEAQLKRHREYAAATFRKDKRINVRLSERDLRALQKRALTEGVPYQTLVSSILHKYVEGRLAEKGT